LHELYETHFQLYKLSTLLAQELNNTI